jgi:RNA polymerase sigma factor (sigma-70 family)
MGFLFDAASRGDRQAQAEVARLVRNFAQALCRGGGPPAAPDLDWEDVAQEAARKIFSVGLTQYRGQGTERSYLYSAVKSTMIQMSRTAARRRRREAQALREDLVQPDDPGPKLQVAHILDQLPQDCRALIERVFLHEEPYADLARDLAIEESSVRARVSRCIRRARSVATEARTG